MDLIDREYLFEAVEQMEKIGTTDNENDSVVSTNDVLDIIDNAPTVNRCIPCSERLPEKSGLYLTYQKELGRFQLMRYSPVLRNGTGWFDDNYGPYVTHWMPLPEPPEGEQKWGE